ncbi:MAG TPA: molybdopterin biosynthesis protein [Planctomycetaceae bacterium]|nr:molybdopterin biosynthesis protein [Planctomycetaceae bacterium]
MDPISAARQDQFLDVIDRDEARRRFHAHLRLTPPGNEIVPLDRALERVLADDVLANFDVPGFDRANVDGFALQAVDTFGATESHPRYVVLSREVLSPGVVASEPVRPGMATTIATGGMLPRGADAVLMIEHSDVVSCTDDPPPPESPAAEGSVVADSGPAGPDLLRITRAVSPGEHVSFAGTDIARGETVLRAGQSVTSREIGVLAAIGRAEVAVYRRPRVAILSTGDEIIAPGAPLRPGTVFDSNGAILAAAVREAGGEPIALGIVADDEAALATRVAEGLQYDLLLLSGGTSKGAGDLSYRVVRRWNDPGIVAHGVALKPGKPICLAVTGGKPVVILPGFPTSAIFTFHEFVAPVIEALAGRPAAKTQQVAATLPMRVNSERGRTEYLLVNLVWGTGPATASDAADNSEVAPSSPERSPPALFAYPMGKGSGSVTTFSGADGFITIDQHTEMIEADSKVRVQLLGQRLEPADLVVIGSHCVGLDDLLGQLQRQGISVKVLNVGSTGGLSAARRGQCDLAGIHLLDPDSGEYNRPFLGDDLELIPGYGRLQGFVFRRGDQRFEGQSLAGAVTAAVADPECTMVNRNAGSGTRILIDRLLAVQSSNPSATSGYAVQARSHNAVAAAVSQGRADWGIAIDTVARLYGLGFIPLTEERYDFVTPRTRKSRPAVEAFRRLLTDEEVRGRLRDLGFRD